MTAFLIAWAPAAVIVAVVFGLMARPPSRSLLDRLRFAWRLLTAKWEQIR